MKNSGIEKYEALISRSVLTLTRLDLYTAVTANRDDIVERLIRSIVLSQIEITYSHLAILDSCYLLGYYSLGYCINRVTFIVCEDLEEMDLNQVRRRAS